MQQHHFFFFKYRIIFCYFLVFIFVFAVVVCLRLVSNVQIQSIIVVCLLAAVTACQLVSSVTHPSITPCGSPDASFRIQS